MINLIRCDDRLIHGQCMTRLVPHYKIKHILVIDEFTATNPVMRMVFEKVAMPGMKNDVFTLDTAIETIKTAVTNDVSTMIVFRFPLIAKDLFEKIENLPKSLMVGPVQKRDDALTVQNGTYCTKEELLMFDELAKAGVDVFFQVVPDMKRLDWDEVRGKLL